ncbi:M23 family metallopeptidase [Hyunsoonleella flava]|uniref:M23 family metallopeptidase n=1 Tax=Hyunsoonleella flava TaxID=2527939 RepID=A0A4Q9FIU1_9FLAO|nr:M23 family metallopeptidase [Hyunsoonleella flava]TBN03577.1 M23 family metallopeptidase [Hyunsoonleella flava]
MRRVMFSILIALLFFESNGQDIKFSKIKSDTATTFNFVNKTYAPITLKITHKKDSEIRFLEGETLCKPQDSLINVVNIPKRLFENDSTFETSDYIGLSYSFGKRLHKDSIKKHLYELPFQKRKRYKIMQGFNGKFSHRSVQSKYAIDFKIPIGDTIVAARNGYVVRVVSHFTERGGKSFRDKANQIVIVHDDATFAYYVHLDTNGTLVEVNDYVEAGQPIGIAGFTGYTTKPHLHFVVRNYDTAIPIEFKKRKDIGKKSGVWVRN